MRVHSTLATTSHDHRAVPLLQRLIGPVKGSICIVYNIYIYIYMYIYMRFQ